MTGFKKVLRYSGYLLLSRLLSRLASVIFFIYAASRLGPELFGILSFALVTVELLSAIGDLGLTRYGARELVRYRDRLPVLAGEILSIQVISSVALSALFLAVILAWHPEYPKMQLLLLGLVAILLSGFVNTAETIFLAGEKFLFSALLTLLGRLLYVASGFVIIATSGSVVLVMWGFLLAVTIEALLRLTIVVRKLTSFSFAFSIRQLRDMLVATLPFAVAAVANIVFLRISVVVLEFMKGDIAVGVYNVAFTFFSPFVWVPMLISRAAFPGLTATYADDPQKARADVAQWYRFMALSGIPVAIAVSFLAVPALAYFPAGYEGSDIVLQILIWTFPLLLFTSMGFNVLQIIDRERFAAGALASGALLNLLLCVILVPLFGIYGAALAMLAATAVPGLYIYLVIRKHFLYHYYLTVFIRPLLAGAAMALVSLALWRLNSWAAVLLGMLVYILVILASRGVRLWEIKALIRG